MTHRRGDWIQTYTLRQFWPLDPRPEDVDLTDIAHALSLICRFTGHVREFYSVAQHSLLVADRAFELAPPERDRAAAKWGLLHDASEAYLVDVARPVKRLPEMAGYREAERRVQTAICERFGLPPEEPPEVKQADRDVLYTEARDLFNGVHRAWRWEAEPLGLLVDPLPPAEAERRFLQAFAILFPEVKP